MADAYTMFWTRERCDALRRLGWAGRPLEVLFGGPHTSEPSFRRACVRPGDAIYPIAVRDGILYVLGRARVQRILTLEDYIEARADLFDAYLTDPPAGGPHHVLHTIHLLRAHLPERQRASPT